MQNPPHIAIVGATGAVGLELLRVLDRRNFPIGHLTLLASSRSAGKQLLFQGKSYEVKPLTPESFDGVDIALFSAGGGISKEFAPHAVKAGTIVVDNSSAFRMDPEVPLVIPEINAAAARHHRGIIANPNCTTAVSLMAVAPLHRAFGLRTLIASSYQAVSGSGAKGPAELEAQMRAWADGGSAPNELYPHPIAFNVIPRVDASDPSGYTREELKMVYESRKILDHPDLRASITCVRVPVLRTHSVSITAQFDRPITLETAQEAWKQADGLEILDDLDADAYPTPLAAEGHDNCFVGRARIDLALDNALTFWVAGDQLLKGAALNTVQIAELLV